MVSLMFFAMMIAGLFLPALPGAPMAAMGFVGGAFFGIHWVEYAPPREWRTWNKVAEWFEK